ncbi:MAG: Ig-like domain-containing protein [Gemmatimonadaceae bacterium]
MKWFIAFTALVCSVACRASDPTITVCPSDLRGVFSPADTTILVGQHFSATLTVLYCGGGSVRRDTVAWKSEDISVVTVDSQTGFVTGVGTGNTELLALTQDGTFAGSHITVH